MSEIFHIRLIKNNVKVDTLVDSGSEANLMQPPYPHGILRLLGLWIVPIFESDRLFRHLNEPKSIIHRPLSFV
jgi:hypothetical protein